MTRIAALSVQTPSRPVAARTAAPSESRKPETVVAPAPVEAARKEPTPAPAAIAPAALGVLIQVQAHAEQVVEAAAAHLDEAFEKIAERREDHQDHEPPASAQPPVVQPPAPPPATPSPVGAPAAVFDPLAPARAIAMVERRLQDEAVSQAARDVFAAAAAEQRAQRIVADGRAALAILQALSAHPTYGPSSAHASATAGRRGIFA